MRHIVGVADMKICRDPSDVIVTHALGSCLGISAHDPVAHVGGLLHVMMPLSHINPDKAKLNPYMFVDTGVPVFFREIFDAGASKRNLVIKVAGGAQVGGRDHDHFAIGRRNHVVFKKLLWKNSVLLEGEDVGGTHARTMYVEIGSGRVQLSTAGIMKEL